MSEADLLRAATAVACAAGHPAARALLAEADVRMVGVVDAVNGERSPCGGVAGVMSGSRIVAGGPEWLLAQGVDLSRAGAAPQHDGWMWIAADGRFAGWVGLDVRPGDPWSGE
jgi:cation transport ATPase